MKLFLQPQQRNLRLLFYLRGLLNLYWPCTRETERLLTRFMRFTPEEVQDIQRRADYYLKLNQPFSVGEGATTIREFRTAWKHRRKSTFFFDLQEHLRHFDGRLRFLYRFGDDFSVPAKPAFVKARELSAGNHNAVLMKLNKVRHFNYVADHLSWEDKLDRIVWRGNARRPHRQKVVREFYANPLCDIGQTNNTPGDVPWKKPFMSIRRQLRYKFVLSIQGNDVATNLKWIMASNSLCFMAQPTRETWFQEGELIPGRHYVRLRDDYQDMEEKIDYYRRNPAEAKEMVRNANLHAAQFRDEDRETLVSLYVLDKYFFLSGQSPTLGLYPCATRA